MSFLSPKVDVPTNLSNPDSEQISTYGEAKPVPNCRGNGRLGLKWICENTTPEKTQTGERHFHYHANIAGVLNMGIIEWIGEIEINGSVVYNANYYWNGSQDYQDFSIDTDGGHTDRQTTLRVYFGTETQTADSDLNGFHPGESHPGYRGVAYCVLLGLYGGDGSYRVPNVTIQFRTLCQFTHSATDYGDNAFAQGVNPVNYLHHIMTHPRAGLGLNQDTIFDMDDMVAKHNRVHTEANAAYGEAQRGYISPQMTKNRKAKDWLRELLSYNDGFLAFRDSQITMDWFPHETLNVLSPSQYKTIYQADLTEEPNVDFPTWEETTTGVAVDFLNIEKRYRKTSLVARSIHAATVLGDERIDRVTRDWYSYTNQAQAFADRYLAARDIPHYRGKIRVKRERAIMPDNVNVAASRRGKPFIVGDVFNFNYAPYSLDLYVRITKLQPRGKNVDIEWVQERGTFPVEYTATPDPTPDRTLPTPPALADWEMINIPTELSGEHKNWVGVLAERRDASIVSWDATFNDNDTWGTEVPYLEELRGFGARFTLNEAVADTTAPTTFEIEFDPASVDVSQLMQSLDAKQAEDNTLLLIMNGEWMSIETVAVVAANRYDVTAYRGRFDAGTTSHSATNWGYVVFREDLKLWYHEKWDLIFDGNGDYSTSLATKYFKTRSRNIFQEGSWSASESLVLQDLQPDDMVGGSVSAIGGGIQWSWTQSVETDILKNGYAGFWLLTAPGTPTGNAHVVVSGNSVSAQLQDLTVGQIYYVYGKYQDGNKNVSKNFYLLGNATVPDDTGPQGDPGTPGVDGIVGYGELTASPNWVQAKHGGAWDPVGTTVDLDVYFDIGGTTEARVARRVTRDASGNLTEASTAHKDGDLNTSRVTWSTSGSGTSNLRLTATYNHDSRVYSVSQAFTTAQGGDQGDTGDTGQGMRFAQLFKLNDNTFGTTTAGTFSDPTSGAEAGWTEDVPALTADGDIVYMVSRLFTSDGLSPQEASWSSPTIYAQRTDGTNGTNGTNGTDGEEALGYIPMSFLPGGIGGNTNAVFEANHDGTSANDGEIWVQGSRFITETGAEYSLQSSASIFTNLEGAVTGKYFLCFSATDPSTRWPTGSWGSSNNFFTLIDDAGTWKAIDNVNTKHTITIAATDTIMGVVRKTDTSGGIDEMQIFAGKTSGNTFFEDKDGISTAFLLPGDTVFDSTENNRIYRWNGSSWVDVQKVLELSDFGTGIEPISIVAGLPTLPDADYPNGAVVTDSTDSYKMYWNNAGTWTKKIDTDQLENDAVTADILAANSVVAGSIQAGVITGDKLAATNIITATAQIQGAIITDAKISDLSAGKITAGTISGEEIIVAGGASGILRSSNFVTGPTGSGWRLLGDGTMEIIDGTFRGTVQIEGAGTESTTIDSTGFLSTDGAAVNPFQVTIDSGEILFKYNNVNQLRIDSSGDISMYDPSDAVNWYRGGYYTRVGIEGKPTDQLYAHEYFVLDWNQDPVLLQGVNMTVEGFTPTTLNTVYKLLKDTYGGKLEVRNNSGSNRVEAYVDSNDHGRVNIWNNAATPINTGLFYDNGNGGAILLRSGITAGSVSRALLAVDSNDRGHLYLYDEAQEIVLDMYAGAEGGTLAIKNDDATPLDRVVLDVSGNAGRMQIYDVSGGNTIYRHYDSSETDITGLIAGTTFGSLIEGRSSGHFVIGLRGNTDTSDSFAVIKDITNDGTYDERLFHINSNDAFFETDVRLKAHALRITNASNTTKSTMDQTSDNGRILLYNSSGTNTVLFHANSASIIDNGLGLRIGNSNMAAMKTVDPFTIVPAAFSTSQVTQTFDVAHHLAAKPDVAFINCVQSGYVCGYDYDNSSSTNCRFWIRRNDDAAWTGTLRFSILIIDV